MASKASKDKEDPILQRLDTLIRLQAKLAVGGLATQKDRILFLSSAGLTPKQIGDVLGTSANSVSVALTKAGKAGKTGKPTEESKADVAEG